MTSAPPSANEPQSAATTAVASRLSLGDTEFRPDPDRWKALAVVLAAGFMTLLDVSIVNVALPSIEQGLHAQPNALEWIVAGYALALGLLLVPAGRLRGAHRRWAGGASARGAAGGGCSWSAWRCSWSRAQPRRWRRRRSCLYRCGSSKGSP